MALTIDRYGRGLRRLAAGTALAAILVGSGGALALAQPAPGEEESLEAARRVLLGATVQSFEVDTSNGAPALEVDVRTRDGGEYEVTVDMSTATVLSVERDED